LLPRRTQAVVSHTDDQLSQATGIGVSPFAGWHELCSDLTLPPNQGGSMKTGISRRQFHTTLGWGAASIALSEFGLTRPGVAEENFTLASTGATWGEGLRASFVDAPKAKRDGPGFGQHRTALLPQRSQMLSKLARYSSTSCTA
jgi:hypothetical protein